MDIKERKKIEKFFSQFDLLRYKKGDVIIHPEKNLPGVFYLKKGYVRKFTNSLQGAELTLHIFVPGCYFPMTWAISGVSNRYYFEALTPIEVFCAPKGKVANFLKTEPEILLELTGRLLKGLDKLTTRIESLVFSSAYARVASVLLFLGRHFGKIKDGNKISIAYKFIHKDIASIAGISRETASRAWEKLLEKNIITSKKKYIVINDVNKLKKELN